MTNEHSQIRRIFSRLSLPGAAELTRVAQGQAIAAALCNDPRTPRLEAIALVGMAELEDRRCHEEAPTPALL
jgi:hypothetical protein